MKSKQQMPNRSFLILVAACAIVLSGHLRRATAQTNTFPSTGNVGVGTASPASILTVETTGPDSAGEKYLRVRNTSSFTGILLEPGQAGDTKWLLMGGYPNAGDFVVREYGVANHLTIKKTTGNVGIGTTSPGQLLELKASSPVLRFN